MKFQPQLRTDESAVPRRRRSAKMSRSNNAVGDDGCGKAVAVVILGNYAIHT